MLMPFEWSNLLISAYSLTGGMVLAGFVPQIWKLIIATGRSKAISVATYLIWTISSAIGTLYASFIVHDVMIALISLIAFVGNLLIVMLTLYNRFLRFRHLPYTL